MTLRKDENEFIGSWGVIGGKVEGDAVERRIAGLIDSELTKLGSSDDGWNTLFVDDSDGRFWELSFPNSEMHGGGPMKLTCVDEGYAKANYSHIPRIAST